jgi:hypothetical protein
MRKFFLAVLLAAAAVAVMPDRSSAWGRDPYWNSGFGTLGGMAFNHMRWIHSQGPLYNYGPYYGPGHVDMHIPKPWHGSYMPANPYLWNQGGYAGAPMAAAPAPAIQAAPQGNCNNCASKPAAAPAVPAARPTMLPNIPPQNVQGMPAYGYPYQQRILPASYDGVYPAWLSHR